MTISLSDGDGRDQRVPTRLASALNAQPPRPERPSLRDLVEAGLVAPGTRLQGFFKGAVYVVVVDDQGRLHFEGGRVVDSLGSAVKIVTGWKKPPSGWTWWHVRADALLGELIPLAEIRQQAEAT